jgi:Xaa-Pro aminopeptidase
MTDIRKRLKNLRGKIAKCEADAVLVTKRANYMYLSGFTGTMAYLVITENRAVLITDFRYTEQAAGQAPEYDIVQYRGSILDALKGVIEDNKIERLAFEDFSMTVNSYTELREKLGIKGFVPFGRVIEELRQIKDEGEIRTIRRAVEIADETFKHILGSIRPGVAEVELAAEMEYHMKKLGASAPSFETIVASGKRASMPHGVASEKKLEAGDVITLDFGALYNGYCSDMTRTVFLGEPDKELARIYGIVLEAQLKSLEGVKKGKTGKEIDLIARQIIAGAGFGDNFGHGLGHSVGLEIHEDPRLSMTCGTKMRDGMVVTVEPGIYVNGLGGVRIEDMVVVKGDSPVVLTSSTKEMIVL